jgi:hypothetical protein
MWRGLLRATPFAALVAYSAVMLWIEGTTSQEYVRRYFTDIGQPTKAGFFAAPTGDTIFYAVNTSLSSFMLGVAGVLMLFAAFARSGGWSRRDSLYAAQGAIFLWLALDDRFMFHEHLGAAFGIPSTVILMTALAINLGIYLAWFRPAYFSPRMAILLVCAGAAFAFMMVCDLLLPHDMFLRLSLEDLSKTWAAFAFLSFAWETARFRLVGEPAGERPLSVNAGLLNRLPDIVAVRLRA